MSAALPRALRARFEECIIEGLSGRSAAARLKLSAATGVRWLRRLREQGDTSPDPQGRPKGHGKLAPHRSFLEDLVDSLRQKSLFVGFPSDRLYATVLDAYRNIIHGFIGRPRTA